MRGRDAVHTRTSGAHAAGLHNNEEGSGGIIRLSAVAHGASARSGVWRGMRRMQEVAVAGRCVATAATAARWHVAACVSLVRHHVVCVCVCACVCVCVYLAHGCGARLWQMVCDGRPRQHVAAAFAHLLSLDVCVTTGVDRRRGGGEVRQACNDLGSRALTGDVTSRQARQLAARDASSRRARAVAPRSARAGSEGV